jgi:hypothetical protein
VVDFSQFFQPGSFGWSPGGAPPPAPEPPPVAPQSTGPNNFDAAHKALDLNPQEKALYMRHLSNLWGSGGVDNPDGSRSSLYQAVQEHEGKFYNIPTVWNGKIETESWTHPTTGRVMDVPNETALKNVDRVGWDKFPSYATPDEADARYEDMHKFMEQDTGNYLQSKMGGRR